MNQDLPLLLFLVITINFEVCPRGKSKIQSENTIEKKSVGPQIDQAVEGG